jgi:hypothetical protein
MRGNKSTENVMADDKSSMPEKYDFDLDELSDDKPIVAGSRKPSPSSGADKNGSD